MASGVDFHEAARILQERSEANEAGEGCCCADEASLRKVDSAEGAADDTERREKQPVRVLVGEPPETAEGPWALPRELDESLLEEIAEREGIRLPSREAPVEEEADASAPFQGQFSRETVAEPSPQDRDVASLFRLLQRVQETRVRAYRAMEEALKRLLDSVEARPDDALSSVSRYRSTVSSVTSTFEKASEEVRCIQRALRSRDREHRSALSVASLIDRLQATERQKLRLTADLHVQKQARQTGPARLAAGPAQSEADAAGSEEHEEETERALDGCVQEINAVLEEMQCEMAEILLEEE